LPANKQISFENIHRFLRTTFAGDLHAKRILSLAGATLGAIEGCVANFQTVQEESRESMRAYPASE
jgi:hypothetical protein